MTEFISVFQLTKTIIFEVEFYTLGTNKRPYFTTSAAQFARNKRDYIRCGQAQEELTKGHPAARNFYKKWDPLHLSDLTEQQYTELQNDLEKLKATYNYMLLELDETTKPYHPRFSFYDLANWTKQPPKQGRATK